MTLPPDQRIATAHNDINARLSSLSADEAEEVMRRLWQQFYGSDDRREPERTYPYIDTEDCSASPAGEHWFINDHCTYCGGLKPHNDETPASDH